MLIQRVGGFMATILPSTQVSNDSICDQTDAERAAGMATACLVEDGGFDTEHAPVVQLKDYQ